MAFPKINEISLDDILLENNHKVTIALNSNDLPSLYSLLKCSKNRSEITVLEARSIHLMKVTKSVVLNLVNLSYICLCDNNLRKITKNFLQLKSLVSLQLDRNQITSIPPFIKDIASLEELSLCSNQLTLIPIAIQFCVKLKIFKVSNNKIASLPIEFGLLKNLHTLHIDHNYFDQIPTTLCYLKQLNDFKLEWFEFLEPKQLKEQKDGKGIQMITTMKSYLQEMITKSILFCDFNTFVSKANKIIKKRLKDDPFQSLDTEYQNDNNDNAEGNPAHGTKNISNTIFYAIENNYYGIVKAFVHSNEELLKSKNIDNHYPLYISISFNHSDITNYLLQKIDMKTFPNAQLFLYKAIRSRDYNLIVKLAAMGIDLNVIDEQGSCLYHLLFTSFYKSIENCCLIGNFLLENRVVGMNMLNFNKWAPIHIAARRGSIACIKWIHLQNSQRSKRNEEVFNLNIRGKDKWTPLHLAVSHFLYNETVLFIKYGCDLFLKNEKGETARKVTHNFFLTKLLYFEEKKALYKRHINIPMKKLNWTKPGPKVIQLKQYKTKSDCNVHQLYNIEDILENSGASLEEKYSALKVFRHQNNIEAIEKVMTMIIREIDLGYEKNIVILSELLEMIIMYNMDSLSTHLDRLKLQVKQLNKKSSYLEKTVDNTIKILHSFRKKTCEFYIVAQCSSNSNEDNQSEHSEMKTLLYEDNQTDPNYLVYFDESNDHNRQEDDARTDNEKEFFQEMNNTVVLDNNIININAPNIKAHLPYKPPYSNQKNLDENNSYDYISESIIGLDDNDSPNLSSNVDNCNKNK